MGPDDIEFIEPKKMNERSKEANIPKDTSELDNSLILLESLLKEKENEESKYQDFLIKYPWIIGANYSLIESHKAFNDENIPDFTGVRIKDSKRDIIEIKPPFINLFTKDGSFSSEFNKSWNQVERYLDFARQESDYLERQKDLTFDNPKCILLAGYNLSTEQMKSIRRKEKMNPAINILTYEDLFVMTRSTITFIKSLLN